MQPNIYNFFKFLNQKEQRPIPFRIKLIYAPETLTLQELNVEGDLNLINTKITSLPDGLKIGRSLFLRNTPITSLPEDLKVGGYLNLVNTPITSLPKGLKVGRWLDLANTPLSNKTDEEIRAMIGPNGYVNGKILR